MGVRGSGPHHWNALEALPVSLVLLVPPYRRCAITCPLTSSHLSLVEDDGLDLRARRRLVGVCAGRPGWLVLHQTRRDLRVSDMSNRLPDRGIRDVPDHMVLAAFPRTSFSRCRGAPIGRLTRLGAADTGRTAARASTSARRRVLSREPPSGRAFR